MDARVEKLSDLLVKENKAPANQYTGADAKDVEAFVRSAYAKRFPNETILSVRFTAEAFDRQTSMQWDEANLRWFKVDQSTLPVWVVVKDGAAGAIFWAGRVFRMHLKGDTLALEMGVRSSRGPSPTQRMLLSNLD